MPLISTNIVYTDSVTLTWLGDPSNGCPSVSFGVSYTEMAWTPATYTSGTVAMQEGETQRFPINQQITLSEPFPYVTLDLPQSYTSQACVPTFDMKVYTRLVPNTTTPAAPRLSADFLALIAGEDTSDSGSGYGFRTDESDSGSGSVGSGFGSSGSGDFSASRSGSGSMVSFIDRDIGTSGGFDGQGEYLGVMGCDEDKDIAFRVADGYFVGYASNASYITVNATVPREVSLRCLAGSNIAFSITPQLDSTTGEVALEWGNGPARNGPEDEGTSTAVIIGVVAGCLVLVILVIVGVVLLMKSKRGGNAAQPDDFQQMASFDQTEKF